jgi:hypothetical protein
MRSNIKRAQVSLQDGLKEALGFSTEPKRAGESIQRTLIHKNVSFLFLLVHFFTQHHLGESIIMTHGYALKMKNENIILRNKMKFA